MIIATAGHVDHGKTSLVRGLTGTDTDRLPEEKKRGLTIDIGFAYLDTPTGARLAMIDVPGHEKFVRNTIAGVGMADVAMLVVAADDGPMPQTLEHLAILRLMGVQNIVPIVSKIDLVDADRLQKVQQEVAQLLHDAACPEVAPHLISISDQPAITALRDYILALAESYPVRHRRGHFRLAIDRSFIIEGSGTVVTGTVVSGRIATEESVTLISDAPASGKSARVRRVHAQNAKAVEASAGQRCAMNLTGDLSKPMLARGSWLVGSSQIQATRMMDVALSPALFTAATEHTDAASARSSYAGRYDAPTVTHWMPAHLHIGTADIPCRIALLEGKTASVGSLARLICDKPFIAAHGDRFVLRDQSARRTMAGGKVLDPYPPKRGRSRPDRLLELRALDAESPEAALNNLLNLKTNAVNLTQFANQFNLQAIELESICTSLEVVLIPGTSDLWGVTKSQLISLQSTLKTIIKDYHGAQPDQLGIEASQLRRLFPNRIELPVLEHLLAGLVSSDEVKRQASVYRLSSHEAKLSRKDQSDWSAVEKQMKQAGITPPRVGEVAELLDQPVTDTVQFLNLCVSHGKLYKVTPNRYFLPETLKSLAQTAVDLSDKKSLTVAGYRDESGLGRNLVVELLEYFDRVRFTQRLGNDRNVLCAVEEKF